MGSIIINAGSAFSASGLRRGSSPAAKAKAKAKVTIIKGRVDKIETHTRGQYILTVLTSAGQKSLKIGETNLLAIDKGQAYLFTCRPNIGVGDGSNAQWAVTKKPEPAIFHDHSMNP